MGLQVTLRSQMRRAGRLHAAPWLGMVAGLAALCATGTSASIAGVAAAPAWASELEHDVNRLSRLATTERVDWNRLPQIEARREGAMGDGQSDDTSALQGALDSLYAGGTLILPAGTYVQSRCLRIVHARVRILGRGAVLHASNPDDMCVVLEGEDSQLRDVQLTARTRKRGSMLEQARVLVTGRGARVIDNRISGSTAAGIMIRGAREFVITGNHVYQTLADGIHATDGSISGYIAHNVTDMTGDDGIAVVSYRGSPRCSRILVEDNAVSNVSWARGISVVGSAEIIIRANRVAGTGRAAGIIVTREDFYDTYGVDRVIVSDNDVSNVARRFEWPERDQTGQATIDVNAHVAPMADLQVRKILISGNTIADGRTDGIRLLGGVCETTITDNRVRGMGGDAISVVEPTCAAPIAACAGNSVEASGPVPKECLAP
jgi:hypothetical protein